MSYIYLITDLKNGMIKHWSRHCDESADNNERNDKWDLKSKSDCDSDLWQKWRWKWEWQLSNISFQCGRDRMENEKGRENAIIVCLFVGKEKERGTQW